MDLLELAAKHPEQVRFAPSPLSVGSIGKSGAAIKIATLVGDPIPEERLRTAASEIGGDFDISVALFKDTLVLLSGLDAHVLRYCKPEIIRPWHREDERSALVAAIHGEAVTLIGPSNFVAYISDEQLRKAREQNPNMLDYWLCDDAGTTHCTEGVST